MKKAIIQIQGMHCASCVSNIQRSLSKTSGVKNVNVNLIAKKGFVECEDIVKEEELKKAVKRAGYEAKEIKFE